MSGEEQTDSPRRDDLPDRDKDIRPFADHRPDCTKNTGAVILSGDAVHFKDNWDNRRVPGPNFNKEQTIASMHRIADLINESKGQLWINHDKPQTESLKHSPEYYD